MSDQTDEPRFWLKHLVIPIEIFTHPDLTDLEQKLFALVDILDGKDHCFASNEYMAAVLGCSKVKVSNGINKLIKLRILRKEGFDGRKRFIKVHHKRLAHMKKKATTELEDRVKQAYNPELNGRINIIEQGNSSNVVAFDKQKQPSSTDDANHNSQTKGKKATGKMQRTTDPDLRSSRSRRGGERLLHWAIAYWNNLPNTPKHPNPDTKTYKQCVRMINEMERGTFVSSRPRLIEFCGYCDMMERYKRHKWTREEIETAMRRLSWLFKNDPHSHKMPRGLAKLIYNPYSKSKFYSYFLYCNYYFRKIQERAKHKDTTPLDFFSFYVDSSSGRKVANPGGGQWLEDGPHEQKSQPTTKGA